MPMAVVFDNETNGLIANRLVKLELQPFVIEFGCVVLDLATGEIKHQISKLVRPPKPLSDQPLPGSKKTVTDITGITNEMLSTALSFVEQCDSIRHCIEDAEMAIAHNFTFDQEMLDIEFQRIGQKLNWPKPVCTVEATAHLQGERLTLAKLHQLLFNEPFQDAHRALADATATARCAVELYRRGLI